MKNKATLCIVSPEYENVYKVCEESLFKYLADWDHIKVSTNDQIVQDLKKYYKYDDMGQFICAIRPAIVAHYLADYQNILFLGSDVVFFNPPYYLNRLVRESYDVAVTPHLNDIEKAIPNKLLPNIYSVSKTGHINSDFVLWNYQAMNFLLWQAKIHETDCVIKDGVFLDQTWLNYLPCFVNKVIWIKNDGYNAAYWRDLQNQFKFKDNIPKIYGEEITCFQFSGFVKGDPGKISKHCNYPRATGDYLKFLEWYDKKL